MEERGPKRRTIVVENESRIRAILLTCKPGNNPVMIPVSTPRIQKVMIKRSGSIKTPH